MSKQAFHGKITLNSATDLGSGSWEVNIEFSDNLGVNNANGVQVGDVFIFNTGLSEQGTFTRFIVSGIGTINPFTGEAVFTVDYDTTQDNVNVANLLQVVGNDGLATRPSPVYGLYPTPSTDFQVMNDAFAEYVSNMNIKKIDAITGGGSVDLSAYSTTAEMDTAIAAAISAIPATDLSDYSTTTDMNTAIQTAVDGVSIDLTGYATENYVDTSIAAIPATDLSDYSTTLETTSAINTAISQYDAAAINVSSLDDLSDVQVTGTGHTPTEGQALVWNSGHGHWMPGDIDPNLTAYSTTVDMNAAISAQIDAIPATDLTAYSTTVDMNAAISAAVPTNISSFTNDSAYITLSDVPTNVSAFANDAGYLTSETPDTVTTLVGNGDNTLTYTAEDGTETVIDLSLYLDNVNLARITSGTLDSATGIATFTRDDQSTFDLNLSSLLTGITSYNDLADIPTNIAYVDGSNVFTTGNAFTSALEMRGNSVGSVDAEGNSISTNNLFFWTKANKDEAGLLTGGYDTKTWIGIPNWDDGFFLNGPSSSGIGSQYSVRLRTDGNIQMHSGAAGNPVEFLVEQGQIRSTGNIVADGIISGDGSGLINLPISDGFSYGTVKGITTDEPDGNTFLGHEAGVSSSVTRSVFLGLDAGRGKDSGSTDNVAIGFKSLIDGGTQSRQTAIGAMALRNAGFTGDAGSVILMGQTEVDYLAAQAGNLNGITIIPGGSGYTDGTYEVIATTQTKAGWNNITSGSELTLDVVTDGSGVITSVTINNAGSGYRPDEAVIIDGGDGNAAVIIDSIVNTVASFANVAVGFQAGINAKSTRNSVMIGNESGAYNAQGSNNVFIGPASGRQASKIDNSVAIGQHSGSGAAGNKNTFIGDYSGQTVRGDNNIMLGASAGKAYTDANNAIIIGTEGSVPSGQREGLVEIGNANTTRLYIPGVGLDTKLFHDLDNTTDQFMYYDASNQQFRPMEISIGGIEASNSVGTVTNLNSTKLMGGSSTTAQHDLLAFGGKMGFGAFTAEGLRIDDDTWESTTYNREIFELFTGKKDQNVYVTENDTSYTHTLADGSLDNNTGGRSVVHKAWRLIVDGQGELGFCNSKDIQIGVGYIPGGSQARVTIEYATTADLSTWFTAADSDSYFGASYLNISTENFGSYHGLRVTIAPYQRFSNTNGYDTIHPDSEGTWPSINLSSIKMMTSRPGAQGSGPENSLPYDWNANKEITFKNVISLGVLFSPPASPVDGMIAIADGTSWNPAGTGTQSCVVYLAGNWVAMASA